MDLLKIDNTEKVGDLFNKALPKGQLEEFLTELMVFLFGSSIHLRVSVEISQVTKQIQ